MRLVTAVIKPFKLDDVKTALEARRRAGHHRQRGAGLRPPARPHRGLPRRRVHRRLRPEGAGRGARRRRRRGADHRRDRGRPPAPARSATARSGARRSTRSSASAPGSVVRTPSSGTRAQGRPARPLRRRHRLVGAPLRAALTALYDGWLAELLGVGRSGGGAGRRRRAGPAGPDAGQRSRPRPRARGPAATSPPSRTRSGTRLGQRHRASTTRCAPSPRRPPWPARTSRRPSACSTPASSPATRTWRSS